MSPAPVFPPPPIEVQNLNSYYGNRHILKNINLTVARGEILVLMGGSGAGKTTLLNHLLGLMIPATGSVRLLGRDIETLAPAELQTLRTRIGVAFQSGALFSSMTVGDNIALPLREHTALDETAIGAIIRLKLEMVALSGAEDLMPSELSGGMVKRAALARAIALDPQILFCDEPSAGLDPAMAAEIDALILRLRETLGMTMVVITHDRESAFTIADRICVLDKGEILALDTVDGIRANTNARIQNLLHRRIQRRGLDPGVPLDRRMGENDRDGNGILRP
jgi:phospholipid/cholesterol/gamma-HCH transport system ATP-binding protein